MIIQMLLICNIGFQVNMLLKNLNDLFSATKSKIPRIKLFASAHKCINILARARISVLILFGT